MQNTEKKSSEALWLILAALAALLLLLPLNSASATPAQIDEFIVLSSAKAIYQGSLPYRDYFNFIPPLSHAIYTGLFALVGGPNAGAARLLTDLIIIFCGLLAYGLLRRFGLKPWAASLPGMILLSLFFALWPIPLHHWWGLFFSLLSLDFLAKALWPKAQNTGQKNGNQTNTRAQKIYLIASGTLLGLSGLTVQTHGFINLAALIAMLLFASQTDLNTNENPKPIWRDRKLLLSLLMISLGTLAVLGLFTLYLVVTGTFVSFFNESILFVFFQYSSGHNHNSMPFLSDLPSRLQTLAKLQAPAWIRGSLLLGTLATLTTVFGATLSNLILVTFSLLARQWRQALALSLPWIAAWLAMLGRPDLFHLAFYGLIPFMSISLALFFFAENARATKRVKTKNTTLLHIVTHLTSNRNRLYFTWQILISLLLVLGIWGHLLLPWLQGARVPGFFAKSENSDAVFRDMPAIDAALVQSNGLYELIRSYALQHPDAHLFASIDGIPAYFLAMPPACRETVLYPPSNSFSGARQYQRVLDDFRRQPPELLLFMPQNADQNYLDIERAPNAASRAWIQYVKAHYHFVISNGRGRVYQRNDAPNLQLEL